MLEPLAFTVFANPRCGTPGVVVLPSAGFRRAHAEITSWDGYVPTPLHDLPEIAAQAGVAAVRLKDESGRFGLGSFKALGGAYAVVRLLAAELARTGKARGVTSAELTDGRYAEFTSAITVTCATDGNHGRAVAWGAARFHARCVIFVHETVSPARVDAMARYGAEIHRVSGTYDEAVREAAKQAEANGWFLVSDTSWPGYTEVPRDVMQGYRVMAHEAAAQWTAGWSVDGPPTHVFVPAGVGGVATAVSVHARALSPLPSLIVVEPDRAACLLASAQLGEPTTVPGDLDTIMAGLACGTPSLLAWQELERGAAAFMAIPDEAIGPCMRLLARHRIEAGESGVAGLAALLLAAGDPVARETLGLGPASRVLLYSTEGATDPEFYQEITSSRDF